MVPSPSNPICASHERRLEAIERRQGEFEREREKDSKLIREMHSGMGRMLEEVAAARRAAERSADETARHHEQIRQERLELERARIEREHERERESFMSLPEIDPDAPDIVTGMMDRPQLIAYKHKRDSQINELRADLELRDRQREAERKELEARHAKAEQEREEAEAKRAEAEEAKRRKQIQSYVAVAISISTAIIYIAQLLLKK